MFPELKPYLTALVIPPALLLILILLGSLFIASRPKLARRITVLSVCLVWLLSTNAFSVWLHDQVIPEYSTISAKDLKEKSPGHRSS